MHGAVSVDWCKRNLKSTTIIKPDYDVLIDTLVGKSQSELGCTNKEAAVIIKTYLEYAPTKDQIRYIKGLARKAGAVFTKSEKAYKNSLYLPNEYYVYAVEVDSSFIYIGKGYKERWQHTVSGTSHVYELNRLHFTEQAVRVICLLDNLNSRQAHWFEQNCIVKYQPEFNIRGSGVIFENESYDLDEDYEVIYDGK